jgi:predicted nucleotidyltransferase
MTPVPPASYTPFEELLVKLVRAGVDFAVVGGVAVSMNGFVRATEDVDILVHDASENLRRLLDSLAGWGEGWARELKPEDFAPQEGSIRVMEEFDLDVFTRMRGHALDDFRPRLRHLDTAGVRIPYLGPEDLILLKQQSWREKDKLDVAALKEILAAQAGGGSVRP